LYRTAELEISDINAKYEEIAGSVRNAESQVALLTEQLRSERSRADEAETRAKLREEQLTELAVRVRDGDERQREGDVLDSGKEWDWSLLLLPDPV